jgi:hypothetical protein
MADEPQTIFLSYASPDRHRVSPYADALESSGFTVWIDYKRLKAGQQWDFEIRRELEKAAIVIVFISNNSVDRRGYVQREIKIAVDKAQEKLTGDIYLIPVLLDEHTPIPEEIRQIQCVRSWEADHLSAIEEAIRHQLHVIGSEVRAAQDRAKVNWSETKYKEGWAGLPGYEAEYNLLQFSSMEYPQVGDITTYIRGYLTNLIMRERRVKFEQNPEYLNFGKSKFSRTYTFDAHCSEPTIIGNIISISYTAHYYTLGAHGNMYYRTFAFFLDPMVPITSLKDLFIHEKLDEALGVIQGCIREQLHGSLKILIEGDLKDYTLHTINDGTKDWDCFDAFVFTEKGIEIFFAPYQVAAYAFGPQAATVAYDRIVTLIRREYIDGLEIQGIFVRPHEANLRA